MATTPSQAPVNTDAKTPFHKSPLTETLNTIPGMQEVRVVREKGNNKRL